MTLIGQLHGDVILAALRALGDVLKKEATDIELVVVGGAAGMLTGLLPASMTTGDVDAISIRPPVLVDAVLSAAKVVAEAQQLSKGWLDIDAGLFSSALPGGWKDRRKLVGRFARLTVYALGRRDLIAAKFYAHRQSDLEHLAHMNIRKSDLQVVVRYLEQLQKDLPQERSRVELALKIVRDWGKSS